jgi:hypothetical protein
VKRSGRDEKSWLLIHLYMEVMLGISLYSYPYLNYQKCFVFLITAYFYSSKKLEKKAEEVLPEREGVGGERERAEGRGEKWPKDNVCTYE